MIDPKNIYTKFQDGESKKIFKDRLLYSITNESRYIESIVSMNKYGKALLEIIHKKIYICLVLGYGGMR